MKEEMSARENILNRLRAANVVEVEKPELHKIEHIRFKDKVAHFIEVVNSVGGEVVEMGDSLAKTLVDCGIDCSNIVSRLEELPNAVNPDTVADVHELGGEYTAVVRGRIGVAENGAVWIAVGGPRKAHFFACKHLVIVLNKEYIVNTMHNAISQISLDNLVSGIFISGPSKTADIEQALVMGAHGAMKATIILH